MHTYAKPRRGYCASCDGFITDRPVYRADEAYCCIGCAQNGPCICTYEADLAEDGVDHLGLPFAVSEAETVRAEAERAQPVAARSEPRYVGGSVEAVAAGPR